MNKNLLKIVKEKLLNQPLCEGCSSRKIELCKINNEKIILKYHRKKETYLREKNVYLILKNETFLPKLRYYDDKNMIIAVTYVGKAIPLIENFSLNLYENQLINIINIMCKKYNLFHNDLRPKNICLDKHNNIKLIDFDKCSNFEKEPKFVYKYNLFNFRKYYRIPLLNKLIF